MQRPGGSRPPGTGADPKGRARSTQGSRVLAQLLQRATRCGSGTLVSTQSSVRTEERTCPRAPQSAAAPALEPVCCGCHSSSRPAPTQDEARSPSPGWHRRAASPHLPLASPQGRSIALGALPTPRAGGAASPWRQRVAKQPSPGRRAACGAACGRTRVPARAPHPLPIVFRGVPHVHGLLAQPGHPQPHGTAEHVLR